jgi:plasmid stability protein
MKTIQVRGVPESVHAELRSRAAAAGESLSDYVLHLVAEAASRPPIAEVLQRAARRPGGTTAEAAVAAVRAERERRPA